MYQHRSCFAAEYVPEKFYYKIPFLFSFQFTWRGNFHAARILRAPYLRSDFLLLIERWPKAPSTTSFTNCFFSPDNTTMKGFLLAFFIPALLIVSDAKFADSSIIDTSDKCQSALRVKVLGIGQDTSVPRARESCARSCGEGFNSFYMERCPELCGIGPKTKKVSRQPKCTLCYPDKDKLINDCRSLIF